MMTTIRQKPSRKNLGALGASVVVLLLTSQCTGEYVRNRWNDTKDVLTAEVETGSYGASVRTGPLKAGLNYKSEDGASYGLRGGDAGRHYSADFTAFFFGASYFDDQEIRFDDWKPERDEADDEGVESDGDAGDGDESGEDGGLFGLPASQSSSGLANNAAAGEGRPANNDAQTANEDPVVLGPRGKLMHALAPFGTEEPAHRYRSLLKSDETDWAPAYYFTQLEIQAGLFLGLRLGLNPGELFDFLVGWAGFDPFDDDEPYETLEDRLSELPYWELLDDEAKQAIIKQLKEGGFEDGRPLPGFP